MNDVNSKEKPQASKKKVRGTYKKSTTKKVGKEKFLEEFIETEEKPFEWLIYDKKPDALLCNNCIDAKETTHNLWAQKDKG